MVVNDYDVLSQLSIGDVVTNELKYHTPCYVNFNRRTDKCVQMAESHEDDSTAIKTWMKF